jgi:hypothetical protein
MKIKHKQFFNKLLVLLPLIYGIPFTGIIAILSKVSMFFRVLVEINISMPILFIIAVVPAFISLLVLYITNCINNLRKPEFLKFTSMEYKDWLLKWEYRYLPRTKKYIVINIKSFCKCGCAMSADINKGIRAGNDVCPICKEKIYCFNRDSHTIEEIKNIISYKISNKQF